MISRNLRKILMFQVCRFMSASDPNNTTAMFYERVLRNGVLFRTDASQEDLLTDNSGVGLVYTENDEQTTAYGWIQKIFVHSAEGYSETFLRVEWLAEIAEDEITKLPYGKKNPNAIFNRMKTSSCSPIFSYNILLMRRT